MSAIFDKFITKLLAVIVVVLFVVGFRELILTDSNVSAAFGSLMGTLPFAKIIVDVICKIMKCQYQIPLVTTSKVISDLLRLAVMACLQPLVGWISLLFLRVPAGNYRDREEYMNSLGYRLKDLIFTVITAPLVGFAAAYLTSYICNFFTSNYGTVVSTVLGIGTLIGVSILSLVPLLLANVSTGTAIAWRVLVTLGSKMATTFLTNALCLWVYVACIYGGQGEIFVSVLSLIVWLILADLGVKCLQRAVVATGRKS
jgi:hypothetical protein